MRLHAGQDAPLFETIDLYSRRITLAQRRMAPTLLAFHCAANCPLCNLRLYHLIHRYPLYCRQGLAVLAFFESTPDCAQEYLARLRPPFPTVADLRLQVYSRYQMETSWLGALHLLPTSNGSAME